MRQQMDDAVPCSIRAVKRALSVIEAFAACPTWTLKDLGRELALPPASLHRLLHTLESGGYVERCSRRGIYSAGPRLLILSRRLAVRTRVRDAAIDIMEEIVRQTGATVSLDVPLDNGCRACIASIVGKASNIRHMKPLGFPLPLHAGAGGRTLMAFLSDQEIGELISRRGLWPLTRDTITDPSRLRSSLRNIRASGYCVARDESVVGISAVSAPIRDVSGTVVAALTIVLGTEELTETLEQGLVQLVKHQADRVSGRLGYGCPQTSPIAWPLTRGAS